ncbi:MAG: chorismate synthase [Oscillospiraceae bacterium]|jgi:chorismate synthase|nr:chorismate synthase [Oscillospiraceae bacterium]
MRGQWGDKLQLSLFGESHGEAVGVIIDGLPPGFPVDEDAIARDMARRAPGRDASATPRRETDAVRILSGVYRGMTTGAPLCGVIYNQNARSQDYDGVTGPLRPGHADYTGWVKYRGFNDPRGGGHFSGRLTAPLVFAGSLARQLLALQGIAVGAHIQSIHTQRDDLLDDTTVDAATLDTLRAMPFPLLNPDMEGPMRQAIEDARACGDSVGGVVACAAVGVPPGWGEPFFGSVESVLSGLFFSIPAVKGVSFGQGFGLTTLLGSEANDPFVLRDGAVHCPSNRHGGALGGITSGMPVVARVGLKPTPSISQEQRTVDVRKNQEIPLRVGGRHDPCVVPRAVPVVESAMALGLCALYLEVTGR